MHISYAEPAGGPPSAPSPSQLPSSPAPTARFTAGTLPQQRFGAPPRPLHLLDAAMFWTPSGIGGVRRVIQSKRTQLLGQGWRHTLLAPGATGPGEIDCGGLPVPRTGGYRLVWKRRHCADLIEQQQPDVVEAADPYTLGWSVLDACKRLAVPSVAFCHSNLPEVAARLVDRSGHGRRARWVFDRVRNYLLRLYSQYDLVVAPSVAMADQLRSWGLARVQHQHLGVNCKVFTPKAANPGWARHFREDLGLPKDTRLLLYYGRFAPEKRLHLLGQAVTRLGPGYALIAVGHGPQPPAGDRVRVLPPETIDTRLARLIASCDALVHAGDQETFGLAALESMACGIPIVVSRAGGLGELANGVGLRVDSDRPGDWAQAIRASFDTDSARRTELALMRARALDWSEVADQMARRYQKLVQARAVGAMAYRF